MLSILLTIMCVTEINHFLRIYIYIIIACHTMTITLIKLKLKSESLIGEIVKYLSNIGFNTM